MRKMTCVKKTVKFLFYSFSIDATNFIYTCFVSRSRGTYTFLSFHAVTVVLTKTLDFLWKIIFCFILNSTRRYIVYLFVTQLFVLRCNNLVSVNWIMMQLLHTSITNFWMTYISNVLWKIASMLVKLFMLTFSFNHGNIEFNSSQHKNKNLSISMFTGISIVYP